MQKWFSHTPAYLFHPPAKPAAVRAPGGINPASYLPKELTLFQEPSSRKALLFFDYDGTLTPIVKKPEDAVLAKQMRTLIQKLVRRHIVAIVTGRPYAAIRRFISMPGLYYICNHGYEIHGPGISRTLPALRPYRNIIRSCRSRCATLRAAFPGMRIESKPFSVAVHYRTIVRSSHIPALERAVMHITDEFSGLSILRGKKVYELLPRLNWNKGQAIYWFLEELLLKQNRIPIVYAGDDLTDEYAFRALRTKGMSILIAPTAKKSAAHYRLRSPHELYRLCRRLLP